VSYVLDEHRRYLADRPRLQRYGEALAELVRPGDVVVDLASGTGILGLLACRAGAARVYAIEGGPIAGLARDIARVNGYGDRIQVVHGDASDVVLPERADLLVSDQIGRFGFDAGLLALVEDARRRLLKPDARLIPATLDLMVAPVEHARQFDRVTFWSRRAADFDVSPAQVIASNTGYPTRFAADHLLADPATGTTVDLTHGSRGGGPLRLDTSFAMQRAGVLHGIGGWFGAQLSPSVRVSNSPLDPCRIARRQAFFPIEAPVAVAEGDRVHLTMRILPDELVVSWAVTVEPRRAAATTFRHSTLNGMLLNPATLRMTAPDYRPVLTDRGLARRTVLELCDGARTLAQIEAEVHRRHAGLFGSDGEAAVFVGEVVTRYTRDAT
jgi:protein arginine N-methyltransferase 1